MNGNNKLWRVGTVVAGDGGDLIRIVYDAADGAAQAGIETFSTTTDEWEAI